jgi:hypothetical protein
MVSRTTAVNKRVFNVNSSCLHFLRTLGPMGHGGAAVPVAADGVEPVQLLLHLQEPLADIFHDRPALFSPWAVGAAPVAGVLALPRNAMIRYGVTTGLFDKK